MEAVPASGLSHHSRSVILLPTCVFTLGVLGEVEWCPSPWASPLWVVSKVLLGSSKGSGALSCMSPLQSDNQVQELSQALCGSTWAVSPLKA